MNKEYVYIDIKVIISDENDKKTQSEYYDNLDKVLIQENLIETMEGKIQELESVSEYYKKIIECHIFQVFSLCQYLFLLL